MPSRNVSRRSWGWVALFAGIGLPSFILRLSGGEVEPVAAAVIYGLGIAGGAFLLSWAAEAAQLDVPASFAIAVLALIAILPEYAIEAVLAWDAGQSLGSGSGGVTVEMQRVAANVTGSNRLLIGLGWSAVVLIFWVKRRRPLDLRGKLGLEIVVLTIATVLTFLIFLMDEVNLVLAAVLIGIYAYYLWSTSRQAAEEPDLVGPARLIGDLPPVRRRTVVALLLIYSAAVILVAAEPFVHSLVDTGKDMGIDEFLLIQWVAPLASESPEIIVAILFTLRANPVAGLTTLVSAEVSQLTLLVGSMVGIFSVSSGGLHSFPLDSRQSAEFLLMSAMSVFAIVLVAPRLISWKAGLVILGLFIAHLFFIDEGQRMVFAYIFLALAALLVLVNPRRIKQIGGGGSE